MPLLRPLPLAAGLDGSAGQIAAGDRAFPDALQTLLLYRLIRRYTKAGLETVAACRRLNALFLSHYLNELASTWKVYARQAPAAVQDRGVPRIRQLWELLLLRRGAGKLRAEDYYKLRVYRQELSLGDKRKYLSNHAVPPAMVGRWKVVADDKLLTYGILADCGIRTPRVYALCHPQRRHGRAAALASPAAVADWLRGEAPYPLIVKPIRGMYSRDVMLLEGFESDSDSLRLAGGGRRSVEEFAALCFQRRSGYLFQELLRPHRAIRENISERICTLRIIVLSGQSDPRLLLAVWKIALDGNIADNYWREGNLLATLDQQSGAIVQCSTGLGPGYRTVERHPTTGRPFAGFKVPCYREAVDLALRASHAFCDIPVQAWDIALTDDGPVPLEVNVVGSLFIPQLANQSGLLTGGFRDLIESYRRAG